MKKILFPIIFVFTYSLSGQTQLITNGGFTQTSGWITTGDFVYNTANTQYNLDPGFAYSSNTNNSFGNLQQGITIPANSATVTLTLYHKISTNETTNTMAYDVCDYTSPK